MAIPAQTFKDLPDPHLRYDVATNRFVLLKDYVTPEITVPAGQWTDGATRPDISAMLFERYDSGLPAYIVHDYMYRQATLLPGYEHNPKLGADELFEKNLRRLDFPEAKIAIMVTAVKVGGQGNYK